MLTFFNDMYLFLNNTNNNFAIFVTFAAICLILVVVRIGLYFAYKAHDTLFAMSAKPVTSLKDIDAIKFGFLKAVIKDYMKTAEKHVNAIPVGAVVDKHMLKMSLLFVSYDSLGRFVTSFENSMIFAGILLAVVFKDYALSYALAALAVFVIFRLSDLVFDFALLRDRLKSAISEYVLREIGQFFVADATSAMLRFKTDLTASITVQSQAMQEAIKALGRELTDTMKLTYTQMDKVASSFAETAKMLDTGLKSYSSTINSHAVSLTNQMQTISEMVTGLKNIGDKNAVYSEAVTKQLQYIEANQKLLSDSLNRYELSLQDMTGKLGDGLSSIVEFTLQRSYNDMNEQLRSNINTIIDNNALLVERLNMLFGRYTSAVEGLNERLSK